MRKNQPGLARVHGEALGRNRAQLSSCLSFETGAVGERTSPWVAKKKIVLSPTPPLPPNQAIPCPPFMLMLELLPHARAQTQQHRTILLQYK